MSLERNPKRPSHRSPGGAPMVAVWITVGYGAVHALTDVIRLLLGR